MRETRMSVLGGWGMTEAWVGGRITAALQRRIAVARSDLFLGGGVR